MINHRGPEFAKLIRDVTDKLKQLFQTGNDLYLLTCSGTGGLEAAIVNTLSPGDKVLSIEVGVFGDRFGSIARAFGAEVTPLKVEWGKAADAEEVRRALQSDPAIKAVLVTHNETSTGVTNDLESISKVVRELGKLFLVDAVSSMGSVNLPVDEWHCDIAVTGSQKGWMVPPGMAMVSVSPDAWKANATAKMPRFHFDLARAKSYLEIGQTPWTPAVSIVFTLSVALDMMLKEGLHNIFARHARVGQAAREGAKSLGLRLFADEKYASNTVTAIAAGDGLDVKKLLQVMREEHQITLSGGQQSLSGKIFRIGHLGWVSEDDIKEVISALRVALPAAKT
jgi:aspartate aminotransferase-like enzyme